MPLELNALNIAEENMMNLKFTIHLNRAAVSNGLVIMEKLLFPQQLVTMMNGTTFLAHQDALMTVNAQETDTVTFNQDFVMANLNAITVTYLMELVCLKQIKHGAHSILHMRTTETTNLLILLPSAKISKTLNTAPLSNSKQSSMDIT